MNILKMENNADFGQWSIFKVLITKFLHCPIHEFFYDISWFDVWLILNDDFPSLDNTCSIFYEESSVFHF